SLDGCGAFAASDFDCGDCEDTSSEAVCVDGGVGGGGGSGSVVGTSSGVTISTAIGSAVTTPKGCTSVNRNTSASTDRWAIADAVMSVRMNRRSSIFMMLRLIAVQLSRLGAIASIPFRRETKIGQPGLGAPHPRYLVDLGIRQFEIEDINVLRQPFELRGARDRSYILLDEPAKADLGSSLAVRPPDPDERLVVLDPALGDRAIGDHRQAVPGAGLSHLGLVEIGMVIDLIAYERFRTFGNRLLDQRHREIRHADMPGQAELLGMRQRAQRLR